MLSRRSLITGLSASLLAAPAVVRAASLMPVRGIVMPIDEWQPEPVLWRTGPSRLIIGDKPLVIRLFAAEAQNIFNADAVAALSLPSSPASAC